MLSVSPCKADSATWAHSYASESVTLPLENTTLGNQTSISVIEVLPGIQEASEHVKLDADIELELTRWPTSIEVIKELQEISSLAGPMVMMGLLLYARSMTSMLFLGHLGELELAGGSLSIGFANITGYSVLSGLAMGMEPICGQAYGAKRMNIEGVALAAVWTNFNLVLFLVGYLWVSGRSKRTWAGWSPACLKEWKPLLSLAIPSCVSVCLEWWWYEFMIILSGLLPDAKAAVATMGILIQTTSLVYIFPSSLSLAVSTRVGNELGANRPAKARFSMLVALGCAAALGGIAMAFTTTMRHIWGGLFTHDKQILSLTSLAMPIVGLCELGNCPQTTGCGVLRGSARPATAANINLGSFYFVGMPVAVMLGFLSTSGFAGLWIGLLSAQATCATLMLIVMSRTNWLVQAARAKQLIEITQHIDQSICKAAGSRCAELEMKAGSDPGGNREKFGEDNPLIDFAAMQVEQ